VLGAEQVGQKFLTGYGIYFNPPGSSSLFIHPQYRALHNEQGEGKSDGEFHGQYPEFCIRIGEKLNQVQNEIRI
jgi:hypothetical protein